MAQYYDGYYMTQYYDGYYMTQYYEDDEDLIQDEQKILVKQQFTNTEIQEMVNTIKNKFSDPIGVQDGKDLYQTLMRWVMP